MSGNKGLWCLVLHAHLPYIHHPEHEDFLEEDWFFEALTETYIPILCFAERLLKEGVRFRFTINLSPTLCSMMKDELLGQRYRRHLDKMIVLTEKEVFRTKNIPQFQGTAKMYEGKLKACRAALDRNHGDLLRGFKALQDQGSIEIITCCATHGFLPLLLDKRAQAAQVRVGASYYEEIFGRRPKGIWLAECAYAPGVDAILKAEGIKYFFMDTHGLLFGEPKPKYGVFAPVITQNGVAAFARDLETAHQVWSAEQGYPGDTRYREFYRDLGYDLEYDAVKPYLHNDGVRRNIGMKYFRITGKVGLSQKEPYHPDWARDAAGEHASNFMFNRTKQVEHLSSFMDRAPLVVSMYDAELFGHWWYEGPDFLEFLFKKIHFDQKVFDCVTPTEYLERYPQNQVQEPCASSWGDKGFYEVWLNGANDWVYRHIHAITEKMIALAEREKNAEGLKRRALNQMAREVLLSQASDWPFLMTAGTATQYSNKRVKDHVHRFLTLEREFVSGNINEAFLKECEWKDNIFPNINYRVFSEEGA